MESHQDSIYPQLDVDNPIISTLELETGQEKSDSDRDNNVRKSIRCKRPPQSFSPSLDTAVGDRNESSKTKKQRTKSATAPDRPCDLMPNGDPFLCDLCMSPYVINRSLKRSLKNKRSKHNPAPRNKMDPLTGKILMLCNACSITFDRPRKPRKIVPVPTAEEMEKCLQGAKDFAKTLAEKMNRPEAERLYCPVVRPKTCACLQRYINADGESDEFDKRAKAMIDLLMKARELSTEKCYTKDIESKRKRTGLKNLGIGIGNGQKRSKAFEEFVLTQREHLKNELKLCERAVQKVLMYSNNFLHKKLVTEKSLCRAKPVNGMARKGLLQPFDAISQIRCCVDNCIMMAITHKKLLQDWRNRANKGQSEHRRVIAEMLTPSAGARTNCYTFITLVTGASRSTIVQVSHQMKQTGGEREPPAHGMKKFWQGNSRRKSTESVSPSKVSTHMGRTTTSASFTHSVVPVTSKPNVIVSSHNPATPTSNIIIPVSVNTISSEASSLTVQRQQLMQIQQQMFEQQVQQQQQQHLLQQQLLQHTIMQQIGQATDGMPQNLPMLQTMIDQLNVQIQNTQQQLQLSLRTMNMIGSQSVGGNSTIESTQNMLTTAENISGTEPTSRNYLGTTCNNGESAPSMHSNLLQICGSNETGSTNLPQQQPNVITTSNISSQLQTNDQGGFGQNTNQILSALSPPDQQNLTFFSQLSPSQMSGQTESHMNTSQNYFNNMSLQSNGQTIIQVQQSPVIPSSQNPNYVQTFLPGSQLQKGRISSNDNSSLEHFIIQTYPSVNQSVQDNMVRCSQNSVLVQQLNAPVNQAPRLAGPPLMLVNQQQVDCGDGLPSSHLSKELYDIPENGFQQQSTRIDSEHGLLNTPILDLTPAVVAPSVNITDQTTTENTLGTGQTIAKSNLESSTVLDPTAAKSSSETSTSDGSLDSVNVTLHAAEDTQKSMAVTGQHERALDQMDETSQNSREEVTVLNDQTSNTNTSESAIMTNLTTMLRSTARTVQTTIDSSSSNVIVQPGSESIVTSTSEGIQSGTKSVSDNSQSVVYDKSVLSVLANDKKSFPSSTSNNHVISDFTPTSKTANTLSRSDSRYPHVSYSSSNTKSAVTRFHTSPKSAFHTPQKQLGESGTACNPSTDHGKCLQVRNSQSPNVKVATSASGNLHQNLNTDTLPKTCLPNATIASFSTGKQRNRTTRRSGVTKVTQSRSQNSVAIVTSTSLDTSTYVSVPMIQGVQKRSNPSFKQLTALPVFVNQQSKNRQSLFSQQGISRTNPSVSEIHQRLHENVSITSKVPNQHNSTTVYASATMAEKRSIIVDVIPTSTDTTRTHQAIPSPLVSSSGSRNDGTDFQTVIPSSLITQDSMPQSTHVTAKSLSVGSRIGVSNMASSVNKSTEGLSGSTTDKNMPFNSLPPVMKSFSDTSHTFLNFSGPQLQHKIGSVHQNNNERRVAGNSIRQQMTNKFVSTQGISTSTMHMGSHETPVSDSFQPINCTLVINPSQNQRAIVAQGQGQAIIGQIQTMAPSAPTHIRPQLVEDPRNSGDQRTQSAPPLPLVHNTTLTIDSDTFMRLCQQASLIRTPVVSMDMNTQISKNL